MALLATNAINVQRTAAVIQSLTVSAPGTTYPPSGVDGFAPVTVPSGTAGTPSAAKGAVSNHSVAVTPSVTYQAGFVASETKTGTPVTVAASELVSGTKSISQNGTGIDVTNYASVDVSVSPNLQNKTVTPGASDQTIEADAGYDGLDEVVVVGDPDLSAGNIKKDVVIFGVTGSYEGSGTDTSDATATADDLRLGKTAYAQGVKLTGTKATRSGSDVSVAANTVTIPAGIYDSQVQKSIAAGSAATPVTAIPANPTITVNAQTGEISSTVSATQSVTPTVTPGYVSSGTPGNVSVSGSASEQLPTQAAQVIMPGTSDQVIQAGKYLVGDQTVKGDQNLIPENIAVGVEIFGVTGEHSGGGNLQQKTAMPGVADVEVYPDAGYDGLSKVTVTGDADLVPENIRAGVNLFGVEGEAEILEPFYKIKGHRYGGKGNNHGWIATMLWNYSQFKVVQSSYSEYTEVS